MDAGNVFPIHAGIAIPDRPPGAATVVGALGMKDIVHCERVADLLRDKAGDMRSGPAAMCFVSLGLMVEALAEGRHGDMIAAMDAAAACWVRR